MRSLRTNSRISGTTPSSNGIAESVATALIAPQITVICSQPTSIDNQVIARPVTQITPDRYPMVYATSAFANILRVPNSLLPALPQEVNGTLNTSNGHPLIHVSGVIHNPGTQPQRILPIGGDPCALSPTHRLIGGDPNALSPTYRLIGGNPNALSPVRRLIGGDPNALSPIHKLIGGNPNALSPVRRLIGGDPNALPPTEGLIGGDSDALPPTQNVIGGDPNALPPTEGLIGGDPNALPPTHNLIGGDSNALPPTQHLLGADVTDLGETGNHEIKSIAKLKHSQTIAQNGLENEGIVPRCKRFVIEAEGYVYSHDVITKGSAMNPEIAIVDETKSTSDSSGADLSNTIYLEFDGRDISARTRSPNRAFLREIARILENVGGELKVSAKLTNSNNLETEPDEMSSKLIAEILGEFLQESDCSV